MDRSPLAISIVGGALGSMLASLILDSTKGHVQVPAWLTFVSILFLFSKLTERPLVDNNLKRKFVKLVEPK